LVEPLTAVLSSVTDSFMAKYYGESVSPTIH